MIPPQPKFQLARTPPVKRNDDGVKANVSHIPKMTKFSDILNLVI